MVDKVRHALTLPCWLFCLLLAIGGHLAMAAPKAELLPYWRTFDANSVKTLNHEPWDVLLARYTTRDARAVRLFRYAAVDEAARQQLKDYLAYLSAQNPLTLNRDEQFAFWVNLYNALTVELVLAHYPVESIKDTAQGWFSFGPWDDVVVSINNNPLTLNNIEHGILRPIWQDARIHYVVNCASYSCPDIPVPAMNASRLEQQLNEAAQRYINHPRALAFTDNKTLVLSSIYDWYAEDFGDNVQTLFAHSKQYANEAVTQRLNTFNGDIEYVYDWSLNAP